MPWQADGRVAITIDVPGPPPRVLLVRGRAALETVDGVPDGYLEGSRRAIPPEAWEDFETQVRAMYKQMVAVTITPDWARLLDFETTAPVAVEKLMREQSQCRRLTRRLLEDRGEFDVDFRVEVHTIIRG